MSVDRPINAQLELHRRIETRHCRRARRLPLGIGFAWLSMLVSSVAHAHPFHVSIAEAEFNRKTGKLEIALRVHPVDLELALSAVAKRAVDLDETDEVDRLIVAYLRKVFAVRFAGKEEKPLPITWVGKQLSVQHAWLYFELPVRRAEGKLHIENRLFFDRLKDQVNTINFKQGRVSRSLNFTRDRAAQRLDLPLKPQPDRKKAVKSG